MRILIVEDEKPIGQHVKRNLESAGFVCDHILKGDEAVEAILVDGYDCVILDRRLPDMDGLDICKTVPEEGFCGSILMLTSLAGVDDIVEGLEMGADDYLTKPFNINELIARVKTLCRRASSQNLSKICIRNLKLDTIKRSTKVGNENVQLSNREFILLEYLMRNAGKPLTRMQLLEHVWDSNTDTDSNLVDVYINYLRSKIDRDSSIPSNIETVRGYGYKFCEN